MPEVHAKLEQMQTAAGVLRDSGVRVDNAVKTVHQTVDDLVALGFESPAAAAFILRYRQERTIMDDWPRLVKLFADRLDEAAEELAQALGLTQSPNTEPEASPLPAAAPAIPLAVATLATRHIAENLPPMGRVRSWRRPTISRRRGAAPYVTEKRRQSATPASTASHQETLYPTYLARKNKPLYQQLLQKQAALREAEHDFAQMTEARAVQMDELTALKNRALSADRMARMESIPRYQIMRGNVSELNQDIAEQAQTIRGLRAEITTLNVRLDKITPAPGADPMLVQAMEGAQTAEVIKANTQDCVNYIVTRMPIPGKLASDAHLWNENITKMPEYGIRIGHQPLEGSVMVMEREHPYADDLYGHLMYVEKIEGSQIWVTDNYHPEPVLLTDVTDITSGPTITYLYFPWETKG
jgi:hypothetical protein